MNPEVIEIPESSAELYGKMEEQQKGQRKADPEVTDNWGQNVSNLVFQAGKLHAEKAYSLYANIDVLRPYFDVEPNEVKQRIIHSFIPRYPSFYKTVSIPGELYGPLMLVFTLIALLLYGMKVSEHVVQEGTLMGTAFGVCFGYWLGGSALVYFLAYICNTHITFLETLSLMGYALSGHCLTIFLGTAFHPEHSHLFFYGVWLLCGGLTAAKMISVMISRTSRQPQRIVVCVAVAAVHLLELLYFHFAYHKTVEVLESI
ncbi:protein YIPF3-like isoform X1 [Tachypleus tridentatus]|uniref:protein YIPF3-like isoform X1 n=1 Tax=Tachypleus tridentatus TaxID=6853 RepID=UPI003FCFD97A